MRSSERENRTFERKVSESEKRETEKGTKGSGKGIQFIQTKKEKAIEISRVEEYTESE